MLSDHEDPLPKAMRWREEWMNNVVAFVAPKQSRTRRGAAAEGEDELRVSLALTAAEEEENEDVFEAGTLRKRNRKHSFVP